MIAPLDWGLGHTTRCVPLIQYLTTQGHKILFAGNQVQREYMAATIPGINTVHLEGYNISYASSGNMFMAAIARQIPAVLQIIKQEHEWLKKIVQDYHIDTVISDNRYGLHHAEIPCVIMTHQLNVMSGMGAFADKILRKLHYGYLEKFQQCWVVDVPEKPGLAGKLSHPNTLPCNTQYMGLLSQATKTEDAQEEYLLVLLSGPEPQRSILSQKLWLQLQDYKGKIVFAEGSAKAITPTTIPAHINYHKLLAKDDLQTALQNASMVICRSGYSTLMDLVKLQKKAILIPTPGQTEQEYLAKQLQEQGAYPFFQQHDFEVHAALNTAVKFSYHTTTPANSFDLHKQVVDDWL